VRGIDVKGLKTGVKNTLIYRLFKIFRSKTTVKNIP